VIGPSWAQGKRPIEHAECAPLEYSVWRTGGEWAAYVCVRLTPREAHMLLQPIFRWHADGAGRIDVHHEGEQETTLELRADTRENLLGGIRPIWRECYRRALGGGAK
jgi:hypothetical protein